MLEKYEHDTRIMHISGNNFMGKRNQQSYYFSKIAHIWGFATWRRAWNYYDVDIKTFPEFKKTNKIANVFEGKFVQEHWNKLFAKIYYKKAGTWDHQWNYAIFINNGLCITPNVTLISNIGFGEGAIHCNNPNDKFANMEIESIGEILHPEFIIADKEADKLTLANNFNIGFWPKLKRELKRKFRL